MSGDHHIKVKSVMTPFPYTISVKDTLLTAKEKMAEHDIRHLPVSEDGKLLGILSDRDIRWALDPSFGLGDETEILVGRVFHRGAYEVDLNASLREVLLHMYDNRIGSALVTKNGKLSGIFTSMDACKAFAEHLKENEPEPAIA